ncbi:PE-PGRS family protein [Streptomyces sp. NPDC004561]
MHAHDAGDRQRDGRHSTPGPVPAPRSQLPAAPVQRMLTIQAMAGNTAATQARAEAAGAAALAEAKDRLTRSITGETPERVSAKQMRKLIDRRLDQGPMFTEEQVGDIETLAADPKWLHERGLCTVAEAEDYIGRNQHYRWVKRPKGQRLLIATRYWRNPPETRTGGTPTRPDYLIGRHLAAHDPGTPEPERIHLEQERDAQIRDTFLDTFVPRGIGDDHPKAEEHRNNAARANELLAKVFLILRNGLKTYVPDAGTHLDYRDGDVARALAHGGRVNIRIPQIGQSDNPAELTNWLGLTTGKGSRVSKWTEVRGYGTHHMAIGDNTEGGRGSFEEVGGMKATGKNLADPDTKLFGVNAAIGGLGNPDIHGDAILPDGRYGHVFLGFKAPTARRDGALQIGIETTAPWKTNPVGYFHGPTSTEATANPVSNVHGHKADKLAADVPLHLNQRYVDLAEFEKDGQKWPERLRTLEARWKADLAAAPDDDGRRARFAELIGRRPLPAPGAGAGT